MSATSGRRTRRSGAATTIVAAFAAAALSACGSQLADLPAPIGLPEGTPARPETVAPFPAVHDMPAPRATKPLNNDELREAAAELEAARDRQRGEDGKPAVQRTSTTTTRRKTDSSGTSRNP